MDWSRVWEHFTIVAIASVFTILLGLLLATTIMCVVTYLIPWIIALF